MTDNLRIWDALSKTDPAHTKPFSRSGGFKGTALKPIWIIKMMTKQFGPVGIGWGVNRPDFQVVQGDGETLVYCTVSAWHTDPANLMWGVGGDKVTAKRGNGSFNDDEAFKKAFTDALNNALKSAGVGADIHMGQFEDEKYVAAMEREFAVVAAAEPLPDSVVTMIEGLKAAAKQGDKAMVDYWVAHWPAVPKEHRPAVMAVKEKIKAEATAPLEQKAA